MIFLNQHGRTSGIGPGAALLAAGTPDQLHQFPREDRQGSRVRRQDVERSRVPRAGQSDSQPVGPVQDGL